MERKQITFYEFLGVNIPNNITIRNNTACCWVPASKDEIYSRLIQRKPSSEMEAEFLKELKIATLSTSNTKSFFVPIYSAASTKKGKLVTSPDYRPECGRSFQMWEKYAHKFGFEICDYSQFILWLAVIVTDLIGCGRMSFSKALATLCKNAEQVNDEIHTCKLMRITYSYTGYAIVTGVDEQGMAYGKNIMYNRQIKDDVIITASPFLIIPKD